MARRPLSLGQAWPFPDDSVPDSVRRALARLDGTAIFFCLVPSRGAARGAAEAIRRVCAEAGRELVDWGAPSEEGRREASVLAVDGVDEVARDRQLATVNLARDAARFARRAGFVIVLAEEAARVAARAPDAWSARADVFGWSHLLPREQASATPLVSLEPRQEPPAELLRVCLALSLAGLAAEGDRGSIPRVSLEALVQTQHVLGPFFRGADGGIHRVSEEVSAGLVRYPVSCLEGEAGSGKTTGLRRLALQLSRAGQDVALVTASELEREPVSLMDLPAALVQICARCGWAPRPEARPWILLDGLDELSQGDSSARIALVLDDLVMFGLAGGAVMATRPELGGLRGEPGESDPDPSWADPGLSLSEFPRLQIQLLVDAEIERYIAQWVELTVEDPAERPRHLSRLRAAAGLGREAGGRAQQVRNLCRRPLFLAALCALAWGRGGEVQGEAELLQAFVSALIHRRRQHKFRGRDADDLRALAAEVAWVMRVQRSREISEQELSQECRLLDSAAIDALLLGTGLLVRGARGLSFVHAALQDVLVAEQVADRIGWEAPAALDKELRSLLIVSELGRWMPPTLPRLFLEIEARRSPLRLERFLHATLRLDSGNVALFWGAMLGSVWGASPPLRLRAAHKEARQVAVSWNRERSTSARAVGAYTARIAELLGDQELGQTRFVPVQDGWQLAVWPVTNRIFSAFITEGGYKDPRWWGREGWAWRREPARSRSKDLPERWGEPGFDEPLGPVCGLSVHEARAFVRWYAAHHEPRVTLPPLEIWRKAAERSPLWGSGRWAGGVLGPTLVASAAHLRSEQGVEDLGGLVRQYLDSPQRETCYAGYAWCDPPAPLKDTIVTREGGGRRWYHVFGLRLALRPEPTAHTT